MNSRTTIKSVIAIITISILSFGCKHKAKWIGLDNIEAHRAYQDSTISNGISAKEKLKIIKGLITEYRAFGSSKNDTNSVYNYLLSRLYVNVFNSKNIPFYGFLYDTAEHKLNYPHLYENYTDSAFYYSELALKTDSQNIRAMFVFCLGMLSESNLYSKNVGKIPFSYLRNKEKWLNRVNYILNNATRFESIGVDQKESEPIVEIALIFFEKRFDYLSKITKLSSNDVDNISKMGKYINYLDSLKGYYNYLDEKSYATIKNKWNPILIKSNKVLEERKKMEERAKAEIAFNDLNIQHKYSFVNKSAGVAGQIYLYTNSDYTQVIKGPNGFLLHGRGNYYRNKHIIHFKATDGITINGDAIISIDKNEKLVITLQTSSKYKQDDDGYYIKNNISTDENKNSQNSYEITSNSDHCEDMKSFNLGYDYASEELGGGMIADCDYLFQIAETKYDYLNQTCFCKGVTKWLSEHNRQF